MLELYKRIRQRRSELGMSQDELAQKLGYKSRSSINKIEKGENDIPQSKIMAFAKALDTTPEYLMGWKQEDNLAVYENSFLKGLRQLTTDGRNTLMNVLNGLIASQQMASK